METSTVVGGEQDETNKPVDRFNHLYMEGLKKI